MRRTEYHLIGISLCSAMNEEYINEWLQAGETIAIDYQNLLSECGCLDDFSRTYSFAGKYEDRDRLKSSYERIENVADDISDDKARILGDYCSYGRLLFVSSSIDEVVEVWSHLRNNDKLPGMADVFIWFRAGQKLANSDSLLQIAENMEGEGAAELFLQSFHRGGLDLSVTTLKLSYDVLEKWTAQHPNSSMCPVVTFYEKAGRRLFFDYYNREAVYAYLQETGLLPNTSSVRKQYQQELNRRKEEEEKKQRMEKARQERLAQEESFWKSTCQTDTKSAYQNYLRKYPDGTYKKQAKQRLHEKNKRKRRILIAVAVVAAIKFLPSLLTLASNFYETHFQCHTLEVLNDPIFTTTDYETQLAVLDSVISHTRRKKCTEDILPYYQRLDSLNFVLHELRPLFSKPKSGRSKVENYCRTKADCMDSIILVRDYLHWAEAAVPDNKEVKKYRSTFEKLLKRYKIKFP